MKDQASHLQSNMTLFVHYRSSNIANYDNYQ